MASDEAVQLEFTQAEDVSWQIFWTDEYGEAIPITSPVIMDVKDANGQLVMRFSDANIPGEAEAIEIAGGVGFLQLTTPSSRSKIVPPGLYGADLFASVADSSPPFSAQLTCVFSGYVRCKHRITRIEDNSLPVLSANPTGD